MVHIREQMIPLRRNLERSSSNAQLTVIIKHGKGNVTENHFH